MSSQEATYWNTEISDEEINLEANAGDFILAAQYILQSVRVMERANDYETIPDYLKPLYDEEL